MQTFRAYIKNTAGTITWAAWVEAEHHHDAVGKAGEMCPGQTPTLELWSKTWPKPIDACRLEAV